MGNALTKEDRALLERASEMFEETGCVPGSDGEEVPAETMVPDAKKYILETINDPEAFHDPEIWGYARVHAGPFVVGAKMAAKMPQARTSRRQ